MGGAWIACEYDERVLLSQIIRLEAGERRREAGDRKPRIGRSKIKNCLLLHLSSYEALQKFLLGKRIKGFHPEIRRNLDPITNLLSFLPPLSLHPFAFALATRQRAGKPWRGVKSFMLQDGKDGRI